MLRRHGDKDGVTYSSPSHEFVVREPRPGLGVILGMYVGIFLLIVLAAIYNSAIGGTVTFIAITFVLLSLAAWLTFYITQSNNDLVTATQFQNALFSSVAHLHSSFILIVKANGTIVYYSSNYPQMFGGSKRHGLTSLDTLLDSQDLEAEHAQRVRAALSESKSDNVICTMKDVDGHAHNIRLTVHPVPRPSGFFVISGSTLRRRTSDSSSLLEQASGAPASPLLEEALTLAPVGLCVFDAQKRVNYIHPEVASWLGYAPRDMVENKLTLNDILTEDNDASGDSNTARGELTFRHKNGDFLQCAALKHAIPGKPGSLTGPGISGYYLLVLLDSYSMALPVTQTAASASASRPPSSLPVSSSVGPAPAASGDGLDFLLSEAPIAIALINKEGDILKHNQECEHLITDVSDTPSQPGNLFSLIKESQRTELEQAIRDTISHASHKHEHPVSIEFIGDSTKTASLYLSSHQLDQTTYLVAHMIDTTEQKNLEMKYAHSQKMQAVGQLAGGIAHDFNNLLTAMIGFCDLLLMRHPAGDSSFADIMQIKQNANRAANLVRQLLAFSRRQTLQPKLLDMTDVLAELSDLIRRLIGENIELSMIHGRDLGMVRVDQGQLEQVIINLAVNARDAMRDGGILTIRTSHESISADNPVQKSLIPPEDDETIADGDYIIVEVTDTGCGINKSNLTKIFEPFFSTKEVGSGTGLGLATVYGIIKQTGGHIFVESTPEQGTRFALFFKRFEAEKETESATKAAENAQPAMAGDLTGKSTILIVEDETPVRIFSARALRNKGYTVLEADCAEAGLEMMEEHGKEVEVVISDVIMPGLDGPSMVKQIWENLPDMKVIFISGYAEDALVKMEDSTQPYEFLQKPFTLKQLAQKVKELS